MSDSSASGDDTSVAMKLTIRSIKTRFPNVPTVNTETVTNWLQASPKRLIIVDAREAEEYNVSHMEGALRVDPDTSDASTLIAYTKSSYTDDTKIVCYCSLGYRSSAYAKSLISCFEKERSKGVRGIFPSVYNMEGSIFKWANERRPMVNDTGKTVYAHPYNSVFGKLLSKDLRRTEPTK